MGRRNERGLELSFKPYGKNRKGGRWMKVIDGMPHYYATGYGKSDRESYKLALAKYRQWLDQQGHQVRVAQSHAILCELITSTASDSRSPISPEQIREKVNQTIYAGTELGDVFEKRAELIERQHVLSHLAALPTEQLKNTMAVPTQCKATTTAAVIADFVKAERRRNALWQHLEKKRAAGEKVTAARGQTLSDDGYAANVQWIERLSKLVGTVVWDGSERTAANIFQRWRNASHDLIESERNTFHTFNKRISVVRHFFQWAYDNYKLDVMPRSLKTLCAKYDPKSTAKSIPLDVIQKVWAKASDLEKAWIALGLNCGFYAKDISDLEAKQIDGNYLDHERRKVENQGGVHVRYKLWSVTSELIRRTRMDCGTGRVFLTERGSTLINRKKSKSDNVDNHWSRLCAKSGLPVGAGGYCFSNLRDTSSTWIDGKKEFKPLADLFQAHRDQRTARFYVDGKMVETGELDELIDELEQFYGLALAEEKVTETQIKLMFDLADKGRSVDKIVRRLGICRATVVGTLKRSNRI